MTGKDGEALIAPNNTIALDVKKLSDAQLDQLLAILAEVEGEDEDAADARGGRA